MASIQPSLDWATSSFLTTETSESNMDSSNTTDLTTETVSIEDNADVYYLHGMFLAALVVMAIVSIFERRSSFKKTCWGARPGPVIPLNMLDNYKYRWFYGFCYGAMTNSLVNSFLGMGTANLGFNFYLPKYLSIIPKVISIVEICFINYPLFACINASNKWIGSILGLTYSLLRIVLNTFDLVEDIKYSEESDALYLTSYIPTILCLTLVFLRYVYNLGKFCCYPLFRKYVLKQPEQQKKSELKLANKWHIRYTRGVFNPKKDIVIIQEEGSKCSRIQSRVKQVIGGRFLQNRPEFKFSTRMICCFVIVICCTYQIATQYFQEISDILDEVKEGIDNLGEYLNRPEDDPIVINAKVAAYMISVSLKVISAVSALLFFINIAFVMYRYRQDMIRMFRGKKNKFITKDLRKRLSSNSIVSSSITFTGYQIAYMIWGYLITNVILFLIVVSIGIIVILIMNGVTGWLVWLAKYVLVPLIISILFRLLQNTLIRYFFLQKKLKKEDKAKPLALDNRKGFHITNFFMVLSNLAMGFFSCLLRILQSLVLGLVFLGRLDRSLLIPGFEFRDKGYTSYIGMLYMEYTHTHPVLRTFCHLLAGTREFSRHKYQEESISPALSWRKENAKIWDVETHEKEEELKLESMKPDRSKSRARLRWFLFYTLVRNPQLITDRRRDDTECMPLFNIEEVQLTVLQKQYALHKTATRKIEEKLFGLKQLGKIDIACQTESECDIIPDNDVTASELASVAIL